MTIIAKGIEAFIQHCQFERLLNSKTIKAYTIDLRQFASFLDTIASESLHVGEITKDMLKGYVRDIGARYKPKTVRRKIATLNAFFNHAEQDELIVVNPLRKLRIHVKIPGTLPRTIGADHVKTLFTYIYRLKSRHHDAHASGHASLARDIAVLELLFSTGMRVAEVAGLLHQAVDLHQALIRVDGKGNKERIIPICSSEVLKALAEHATLCGAEQEASCFFFRNRKGSRLSEQSIRLLIRKHCHDAGISQKITPHMFRHTIATLLLENGVDIRYIQSLLGHSSITTTQIYAHVNSSAQRKILEKKHPRLQFSCS